ncbi:hypothetical protein [Levilactobacillus wangkuiensis]|uniref:hypothetical protein n=1 Tax=Levilactobacillus wangkuiensis TaxID=2799566 RepID=UPI00194EF15B|nr:hypothetical protein [Levilactobacillus wangkuiensis]
MTIIKKLVILILTLATLGIAGPVITKAVVNSQVRQSAYWLPEGSFPDDGDFGDGLYQGG